MPRVEFESVTVEGYGPFVAPTTYPLSKRGAVLLKGINEDDPGSDSNGAGKTTLIMSPLWVLRGESDGRPDGNVIKGLAGELVNEQTGRAHGICRFRSQQADRMVPVVVERRMGKGGHKLTVQVDGVDRSGQDVDLTQRVIDELVDIPLLTQVVFHCQQDTAGLLEATDAKRKELLGRVLPMGVWERAQVEAARQAKAYEQLAAEQGGRLTEQMGGILRLREAIEAAGTQIQAWEVERQARLVAAAGRIDAWEQDRFRRVVVVRAEEQAWFEVWGRRVEAERARLDAWEVDRGQRHQAAGNQIMAWDRDREARWDAAERRRAEWEQARGARHEQAASQFQKWEVDRAALRASTAQMCDAWDVARNERARLAQAGLDAEQQRLHQANEPMRQQAEHDAKAALMDAKMARPADPVPAAQARVAEAQVALSAAESKEAELRAYGEAARRHLGEYGQLGDRCDRCQQPIGPDQKAHQTEHLNAELNDLIARYRTHRAEVLEPARQRLQAAQADVAAAEQERSRLSREHYDRIQSLTEASGAAQAALQALQTIRGAMEAAERTLGAVRAELNPHLSLLSQIDAQQNPHRFEQDRIEAEQNPEAAVVSSIRAETNPYGRLPAQIMAEPNPHRAALDAIQAEPNPLAHRAEQIQAEPNPHQHEPDLIRVEPNPHQAMWSGQQAQLQMLEAERARLQAERAQTDEALEDWRALDKAFGRQGIQSFVLDAALKDLTLRTIRYLEDMTDGYLRMAISPTSTKADGKGTSEKIQFEISVRQSTGVYRVRKYRQLSGGQRRRIAVALSFAYADFVAERTGFSTNLLVLDEVLQHLDFEGMSRARKIIGQMGRESVISITHDARLAGAYDRVDTVTLRQDAATLELG